jgi:hypothetical protein
LASGPPVRQALTLQIQQENEKLCQYPKNPRSRAGWYKRGTQHFLMEPNQYETNFCPFDYLPMQNCFKHFLVFVNIFCEFPQYDFMVASTKFSWTCGWTDVLKI